MLTEKKFYVMESEEYVFSPKITGQRLSVIVRGTNIVVRSNEGMYVTQAKIPDMDLNVIRVGEIAYVVNVKMYKNLIVTNMEITSRLSLLTESDLKGLDMKLVELYSFGQIYCRDSEDYIYRHKVDDDDQGIMTWLDIEEYRRYVELTVAAMEMSEQQEKQLSEEGSVLVAINFDTESKEKIFKEKIEGKTEFHVVLGKRPEEQIEELKRVQSLETVSNKKKKKLNKKMRMKYKRHLKRLLYIDVMRVKSWSLETVQMYNERLKKEKDDIHRQLTDEGGTLQVFL